MKATTSGAHTIYDPSHPQTLEGRAWQIWAATDADIENLGYATRVAFNKAHLEAATSPERSPQGED